ncbi:MAG: hypothetical protein RSD51_03190 [Malacoplasma sp.]
MSDQINKKKLCKMELEIVKLEKENLKTKKYTSGEMIKIIKNIIVRNENSQIK